jgi:uncharacterized damage-inducible protein DinB
MRLTVHLATLVAVVLLLSVPLAAQTREGVMGDLIRDVSQVETKVMGLAKAIPASAFDWRPGKGVRSTGEVFIHIAADNYFLPVVMGTPAPAGTGITKEYNTVGAFEKRKMSRDDALAELEKSFAFLKASMTAMPDDKLNEPLEVFGQKNTNRGMWIMTATHLHEHLGQLIAYARSNNVTPPWSK